jgi:endonuclease-3
MTKSEAVVAYLHQKYPGAKTALIFSDPFEGLVAIMLSAQTTDRSVNLVTKALFARFPTPEAMAKASLKELEKDLHSLGFYHNKAKNLKALSSEIVSLYGGAVPRTMAKLLLLPGVGTKTAGVFLLETASRPAIPVDTHIQRIALRLGYAKAADDPWAIEKKLEKAFPSKEWIFLHHALIDFGRSQCHAKNPSCEACGLRNYCRFKK